MFGSKLWLRAETKPFEYRRILSPDDVKELTSDGIEVVVEVNKQSIFTTKQYKDAGAVIAKAGEWVKAPKDYIIMGLKELPAGNYPLVHKHVFFAHVYKYQPDWKNTLKRFKKGGGELIDLEFLTDTKQRRVAAFGYWAGYAGAAVGWLLLNNKNKISTKGYFKNKDELLNKCKLSLKTKPKALVIGFRGRSGQGAFDFLESVKCELDGWDRRNTRAGGPFERILEYDLMVNCVLSTKKSPPFLTKKMLKDENINLKLISDVSCDPGGDFNTLPLYSSANKLSSPFHKLSSKSGEIKLTAIDNLPSLLPKESSEDFSSQLMNMYRDNKLEKIAVKNAMKIFKQRLKEL